MEFFRCNVTSSRSGPSALKAKRPRASAPSAAEVQPFTQEDASWPPLPPQSLELSRQLPLQPLTGC